MQNVHLLILRSRYNLSDNFEKMRIHLDLFGITFKQDVTISNMRIS